MHLAVMRWRADGWGVSAEDDPQVGRALMALHGHPHSDQKDKRACQGNSEEEHHQTGTCGLSLTNCILRPVSD